MLRAEQADVATLGRASLAGFTACTELKSKIKDDSVLFFFYLKNQANDGTIYYEREKRGRNYMYLMFK